LSLDTTTTKQLPNKDAWRQMVIAQEAANPVGYSQVKLSAKKIVV